MQHVQAGEAGADDDGVEFAGRVGLGSWLPVVHRIRIELKERMQVRTRARQVSYHPSIPFERLSLVAFRSAKRHNARRRAWHQ